MFNRRKFTVSALAATALVATPALARTYPRPPAGQYTARISLKNQRMSLEKDGKEVYNWPVSTARPGKFTPKGIFKPYFLSLNHKSSLYKGAPMPYSVFFKGNFAIHGTNHISKLGKRASAGCVRLHPDNAAICFGIAKHHGFNALKIIIT